MISEILWRVGAVILAVALFWSLLGVVWLLILINYDERREVPAPSVKATEVAGSLHHKSNGAREVPAQQSKEVPAPSNPPKAGVARYAPTKKAGGQ